MFWVWLLGEFYNGPQFRVTWSLDKNLPTVLNIIDLIVLKIDDEYRLLMNYKLCIWNKIPTSLIKIWR